MNKNKLVKTIENLVIPGLGVLEEEKLLKIANNETNDVINVVNIVCPGYQKRRDLGVETFDFVSLSSNIEECPNVKLMVERFLEMRKELLDFHEVKFKFVIILADVAILNYEELSKKQNVVQVLNEFYDGIKSKYFDYANDIEFVKMSELNNEFVDIPIQGVSVSSEDIKLALVENDVAKKACEYSGALVFERMNKLRSSSEYSTASFASETKKSKKEVARFVKEYGLAGQAIAKLYKNPLVLFTEPSGYMRGYFYNAYLQKEARLPVLYLA